MSLATHSAVPPSAGPAAETPELGRLIAAKDWSQTPIGPASGWSPALKATVQLLVANRFPMLLWWGPDYVSIYNDAYRPVLATKHPMALGRPFREVWPEIAHILAPLIDTPFNGGPASWTDDILLEVNRQGFTEETHFTFAYSPVPDDTAPRGIGGVIATVVEITGKIVGERRIGALRDVGATAGEAKTAEEACALAARALQRHDKDIPFALFYLLDATGDTARLAAASGVAAGEPAAVASIDLSNAKSPWPLADVLAGKAAVTVEKLSRILPTVPAGPWADPPQTAVVVPIRSNDASRLSGFLVAGISPRLPLDDDYRSFLDLVAAQVATAVNSARAYEEERQRAEALSALDRAKTMFFSNVSHEFRTPLALILGPLSDAMAGEGLSRTQLELAHRNSLRLLKLVNSLLDFSRIEAGRAQANYVATDLAALTAELASNFRSACERAGLKLIVDCPSLAAPVHVDRDMWEKIVLNLISNAFKFTFDGELKVSLRQVEGAAELTVRDTGVGIPESEQSRLFERFHRIEGQKSRTHEGSGIGLALIQELVKLHGGTIAAESSPQRGTTFRVRIPLGTAHLPAGRLDVTRSAPSTSVHADAYVQEALRWLPDQAAAGYPEDDGHDPVETFGLTGACRVLLADDNADMREYVRRLLRGRCEVRTASDGEAALADIRAERPDLVLADVMMPNLDGFGLVREIRADPALRDLPVILLSARAGEESRVEGLDAGANDYLVKPFSARELIARVAANLELARVRAESTAALRESEAELRQLNDTLERRVAAESAERMKVESALRQSQKMEAIGQLTGGLAHDFNNLLAAAGGSLELIGRRLADGKPGVERYIQAGLEAVRRAATLTQRLLAFSRQQTLDPKPVDANRLIGDIEELIRRTVGPGIAVEVVGAGGLWAIKADAAQLESALLNLCINGRDAMAPNGGRLTIETANKWFDDRVARERDLPPGQYVSICVSDTGTGMTPEVIEKAFDPFFTTKPVGQGTGLGLSMVYGFVRQSGGQVRIYSELGKGTTMCLYFPRHMGELEESQSISPPTHIQLGGGETVLVVDDEPTLRMLICDVLEENGYAILTAKNGATALNHVRSEMPIDLMITDVGLPDGMNGRQLASEARKLRPDLKILFITGFAENAAVGHGHLTASMEVMTKPFEIGSLAEKIKELIDR